MSIINCPLLKVVYAAFKDFLVFGERYVLIQIFALALAVTHLAENSAVGRGNALDSEQRTVGVEGGVHGGIALQVNVLGGDLTVLCFCAR